MQDIDYSPIKVDIEIEEFQNIESEAFRTVCFISENDFAERTIRIKSLSQFNNYLDILYAKHSTAYNFCRDVLSYDNGVNVILRAKRKDETFEEAYDADENSTYYFVCLESKNISDVISFNDYIAYDLKLQFFSTTENVSEVIGGRQIVYYYQPTFDDVLLYDSENFVEVDSGRYIELSTNSYNTSYGTDSWLWDDFTPAEDVADWDNGDEVTLEFQDITTKEADTTPSFYPEASWIGRCAFTFPSRTQWLFKNLNYVSSFNLKQIPTLSNTSVLINGDKSTVGVGTTTRGYPIDQEISLDWVKASIQNNCWNLLYSSEKVNATEQGLSQFEQRVREVLDVSVRENIFSSYKITKRTLDRKNNKVSFTFTANLVYSILGVDKVEGVIYQ